jgi:hypothetical protein
MAFAYAGAGALDYCPCHYEGSRILFRGPARSLERPYVVVLGATESYGKYVERPYAALIEARLGLNVVNLACVNAGPDVFLSEEAILRVAQGAEAVVVQIVGAQNLSNRYYTVHPRRNDRFIGATPLLRALFPRIDFTEFAFTRHLLAVLAQQAPDRFALVAEELRKAWLQRMGILLAALPRRRVLLWMADAPPPPAPLADLRREPMLVDAQMIAALRPHAAAYVEVTPSDAARAEGDQGRHCTEIERPAARGLPGQAFHAETAEALAGLLETMM